MNAVKGKLRFSNLIALLALFVALGGSAYAATQLPKNSVGAKQLQKNAVTPAKLSAASKATLVGPQGATGATGARGETGPQGPQGNPGKDGARGPGAITLSIPVGTSAGAIATFGGVQITGVCSGAAVNSFGFRTVSGSSTLDAIGTQLFNTTLAPVNSHATEGINFGAAGGGEYDVVVRNTATEALFTRFDLRLIPATCTLEGTVTPSTAG